MNKKITIVTGGAGFIGSNLVDALLTKGYEVRIIDNLVAGKRENVAKEAVFFETDIRDEKALIPIFAGAHLVFHLAALPRVQYAIEHPVETHDVNVTGTMQVLSAAQQAGVSRVVLASSAAVYGDCEVMPLREDFRPDPVSPYALHKFIGEEYLKLFSKIYSLSTVSLRFFNVYGPRLDPEGAYALVVGRFLKMRREGKPLTIVGDGQNTRDYVHVSDVVRALIAAATSDKVGKGEVINVGTGRATSVNELAEYFGGEKTYVPARLEPRASIADISKAKKLLGWEPHVVLKDGIVELLKI